MVSHVVAARLIYHCAPEALQAAVAAALCGAGSVHLGSSEYSAKMLVDALAPETKNTDLDKTAAGVVEKFAASKTRIAGIGHRTHAQGDPRADKLFEIARETEVYGRYCERIQCIASKAEKRHNRRFPVNVTGAIAAIALDMGLPWQITTAFSLIGRTLGTIAHIDEEIKNPMAPAIDANIKANLVYEVERKN